MKESTAVKSYQGFLEKKSQTDNNYGFDPVFMPDILFAFQRDIVTWACKKGRSAVFADCGLGKTFIQLAWAENVARHTGGRVLILTPLSVSFQTVNEGSRIGVEVVHRRDGIQSSDKIVVTNYERLHHFNEDDFTGVVCDDQAYSRTSTEPQKKLLHISCANARTDCFAQPPPRLMTLLN